MVIACLFAIEEKENVHERVLEHFSQAREIDFLF